MRSSVCRFWVEWFGEPPGGSADLARASGSWKRRNACQPVRSALSDSLDRSIDTAGRDSVRIGGECLQNAPEVRIAQCGRKIDGGSQRQNGLLARGEPLFGRPFDSLASPGRQRSLPCALNHEPEGQKTACDHFA